MTVLQVNRRPETVDYTAAGVPCTAARRAWEQMFEWQVVGWPTCPLQWLNGHHRRDRSCCRVQKFGAYDHVFKLRRPDRSMRSLLVQPYHFTAHDAAQLEEWCQRHGFCWHTLGVGFHHPATIAICIYKPTN